MAGRYVKQGCRTGPPGWESIPGLLKKRFTNTGSDDRSCHKEINTTQMVPGFNLMISEEKLMFGPGSGRIRIDMALLDPDSDAMKLAKIS